MYYFDHTVIVTLSVHIMASWHFHAHSLEVKYHPNFNSSLSEKQFLCFSHHISVCGWRSHFILFHVCILSVATRKSTTWCECNWSAEVLKSLLNLMAIVFAFAVQFFFVPLWLQQQDKTDEGLVQGRTHLVEVTAVQLLVNRAVS